MIFMKYTQREKCLREISERKLYYHSKSKKFKQDQVDELIIDV
jgi:hypothetical protein